MKKYIKLVVLLSVMIFLITGCADKNDNQTANKSESKVENNIQSENNSNTSNNENTESKKRKVDTIDYKAAANNQMKAPEKGETVAIIKVKDFGEIKVKFFKDIAPKAVENFTTHAKDGYYDGLIFHRVINEFMIQGGDPKGDGTGGESIWGKGFAEELDYEIVPYKGTLCMASSGTGTSSLGSQFFITQGNYSKEHEDYLKQMNFPEGLIEEYKTYGGYPSSLYLNYTVFGQVYEGIEVIDKIAQVKTETEDNRTEGKIKDKPLTDVVIEKVEITTY